MAEENGQADGRAEPVAEQGAAKPGARLPSDIDVAFIIGRTRGGAYFTERLPPVRTPAGEIHPPEGTPHDQIAICEAWSAEVRAQVTAIRVAEVADAIAKRKDGRIVTPDGTRPPLRARLFGTRD